MSSSRAAHFLVLGCLLVSTTAVAAEQRVTAQFGRGATELPDVEIEVEPIPGDVQRGRRPGSPEIDMADYTNAGTLVARRNLLAGPLPEGPVFIPAGEHRIGLYPGPTGVPVLLVRGPEGGTLRLPLAAAPAGTERVRHLAVEAYASAPSSWAVVFRLPTSSGLLVLAPAGQDGRVARTGTGRPRRTDLIERGIAERQLRRGLPTRRRQRER